MGCPRREAQFRQSLSQRLSEDTRQVVPGGRAQRTLVKLLGHMRGK